MLKIKIACVNRSTGCPAGTRVFAGENADVLAANYQSMHPELCSKSLEIERT